MALVTQIKPVQKERCSVHGAVECSSVVFSKGGNRYLQLETYGSPTRKLKGKVSQSIQFNEASAKQLQRLIHRAFPDLK